MRRDSYPNAHEHAAADDSPDGNHHEVAGEKRKLDLSGVRGPDGVLRVETTQALFDAAVMVTGEDEDSVKKRLRTGTVVTTDDRNWELRYTLSALRFNQSRAVAIDMESATVAAQGETHGHMGVAATRTLLVDGGALSPGIAARNTIAAGIVRTPGDIAQILPNPWFFLGVWVVGGLYALFGASSMAELGAAIPRSGGQYNFSHRALGDRVRSTSHAASASSAQSAADVPAGHAH